LGQLGDFKDDAHFVVQLDALAVGKTQQHTVVQDGIEVLDPERVDGPVEAGPVPRVV